MSYMAVSSLKAKHYVYILLHREVHLPCCVCNAVLRSWTCWAYRVLLFFKGTTTITASDFVAQCVKALQCKVDCQSLLSANRTQGVHTYGGKPSLMYKTIAASRNNLCCMPES